jgi:hypothetical protein
MWLGGQGDESRHGGAASAGWKRSRKYTFFPAAGGGGLLPAPSTQIAVPQDAKLSALAPEPSEQLSIMAQTSGTRH